MADLPSALRCHQASAGLQSLSDALAPGKAGECRDLPLVALAPRTPVISLPDSEKQTIGNALAAAHGERTKAARLLGIGRTTLYRKMKQYGFA
jgi:two-component system response regulator HydG